MQEVKTTELKEISGGHPDSFFALGEAIASYIREGTEGSSLGATNTSPDQATA